MLGWIKYLRRVRVETDALKRNKDLASTRTLHSLAINGALIAGNAPEARVDKLRSFWERVTAKPCFDWSESFSLANGDTVRPWLNQLDANFALVSGAPLSGLGTDRQCLQQPSRTRHWCHIHIACCPRPCS
jgi:hypothetical protein